jgi:hypothetical protein
MKTRQSLKKKGFLLKLCQAQLVPCGKLKISAHIARHLSLRMKLTFAVAKEELKFRF